MIIAITAILVIGVIVFTLSIRPQDLPEPEQVSPTRHLEERKATIYENLRDLQFEYRVGKLSDADYQQTKRDLQKELAVVMAEMDGAAPAPQPAPAAPPDSCPHCGAKFPKPMKFCGECGKSMLAVAK